MYYLKNNKGSPFFLCLPSMLRLSNEVDRIIAQIPVPDKVKELIPNIYLSVFRLFILKQKKTPIEVMSNELNNSFLHTYIAPLIQKEMGLERSKQDVLEYVSKLVEKDCKVIHIPPHFRSLTKFILPFFFFLCACVCELNLLTK